MSVQVSKEFWEDAEWAKDNYGELQKRYKNVWVAVVDKRVISYGKNLREVESRAEKLTGRKDVFTIYVESGAAIY
ncbi:MAG: DUF5678 domain-containing protein [Candidatus Bathyarchaeia archaeon]